MELLTRIFVILAGLALAGMVAASSWNYRRSRRMNHILPLGVSYLVMVALSLYAFWDGYRALFDLDGLALLASYALGGFGLARLLGTSHYPPPESGKGRRGSP